MTPKPQTANLKEVAGLFLKLGTTAFGGPAAHIAMMHHEVVEKRKWVTDEQFLDLMGAANLIPGPNSTEMAIHLSLRRAGRWGLILGGLSFITPAMLIVGGFAWMYVQFGTLPQAEALLYGIKPVMIAIILMALVKLGKKAVKSKTLAVIGVGTIILALFNLNPLLILVLAGVVVMFIHIIEHKSRGGINSFGWLMPVAGTSVFQLGEHPIRLNTLFLTFLKIGSVLYGSGYVLIAFLNSDFVINTGWLTEQQLVDAIAIGQVTPGPVFTTATFIGYLLGGVPGALAATAGIFLPSFIFVALSSRLIPRMRDSSNIGALLDGVNVAALGLMVSVTWQLGKASLVDLISVGIGLLSFGLLVNWKVNPTYLIIAGGVVGLASQFL